LHFDDPVVGTRKVETLPIKQRRWKRGKSLCAYCGVEVATDGDHVVPKNLTTQEARQQTRNMLTVPACRDCNGNKGVYDEALQHYLLIDVDASSQPEASQIFDTKMEKAVLTNRVKLLDRFYEGQTVAEVTPNGIWLQDHFAVPIDFEPVRRALVYLVRGLHYLVFDEIKPEDEVAANIIERGSRLERADGFFALGIDGWHTQGDVFTVAWVSRAATHVYWMFDFYDRVLCIGRSAKTVPAPRPLQ
jgi:hypothetical protein